MTEFFEDENGVYRWSNMRDVWEVPYINSQALERTGYPTQKPEALLQNIIESTTNPGDIVMDFFGGSGTTMAVAEKLDRKWISCDLGKLSYFTMQKRLLRIEKSRSLFDKKKYAEKPKAFTTCKLGVYDLKQTLELDREKYSDFVSQLFEFNIEDLSINGMKFEGNKRNSPVKIFDYEKYKDIAIDEEYLNNLMKNLGYSNPSRIYIVSPATRVHFISDYYEMNGTRFYFLKVPYEMIRELHNEPFEKLRQPRSKRSINEIEEMKGFQFIYAPEVDCYLKENTDSIDFIIDKFSSYSIHQGVVEDFSTLSSIFVNYDYDDEAFILDDVRFWDEIESNNKAHSDTETIRNKNDIVERVIWKFKKNKLGKNSVFILSDTSGNDVTIKLRKG